MHKAHDGDGSQGLVKDRFLTAKSVRERYDDISDMTLFRWLRDPRVAFPAPVYIGRRRYWKVADLITWEQARANAVEVS